MYSALVAIAVSALPNPIAYWDFEDSTGTQVSDRSGNGRHGTITGTVTRGGIGGRALYFNGSTTVTVPYNAAFNLNEFTLVAWVKTDSRSASQYSLVSRQPVSGSPFNYRLNIVGQTINSAFGLPLGGAWVDYYDGAISTYAAGNAIVDNGTWHQVVGTYQNLEMRVYVDGQLDTIQTQPLGPTLSSVEPILLGGNRNSSSNNLRGWLDETRIYNVALSAAQVDSLYQVFTPPVVALPPPPAPTLNSPSNGAMGQASSTTLIWSAVTGATSYGLQLAVDSAFTTGLINYSGITATSRAFTGLTAGSYHWRVNATNANGTSAWSSVWTFAVSPPPAPTLSSPVNGATRQPFSIILYWNSAIGATSYGLQLANDSAFTTGLLNYSGIAATSRAVTGLATSARYYWRVNASNTTGTGAWSGAWSFVTDSTTSGRWFWDFEADNGGFTAVNNITSGWEWGAPNYATGPAGTVSGVRAWGTNLIGPYANSANYALSTPPFIVPSSGILSFWHWLSKESCCDYGYVEISINGGASYANLATFSAASTNGWALASYSLSAYSGQAAIIRWRFTSDGSVTYPGWYLDDVSIDPPTPPAAPILSSPANGATGIPASTTLVWNAVATATTYGLQAATDSTFASPAVNLNGLTTTSRAVNLANGTRYYWRANAANAAGTSPWSTIRTFTTIAPPQVPALVAYWDFEERAGAQVLDKSGNNHHGTIQGAVMWGGTGGTALGFNGATKVTVPFDSLLSLDRFTLMTWVRTQNPNSNSQCLICRQPSSGSPFNYRLYISGQDAAAYYPLRSPVVDYWDGTTANANTHAYDTTTASVNSWHHIAGTYNNRELRIYQDGQLRGVTSALSAGPVWSSVEQLVIGGSSYTGTSYYLQGWMDETRIYSIVLTPSQIDSAYNAFVPPTVSPVGIRGISQGNRRLQALSRGSKSFALAGIGNKPVLVEAFNIHGDRIAVWKDVSEGRTLSLPETEMKSGTVFLKIGIPGGKSTTLKFPLFP